MYINVDAIYVVMNVNHVDNCIWIIYMHLNRYKRSMSDVEYLTHKYCKMYAHRYAHIHMFMSMCEWVSVCKCDCDKLENKKENFTVHLIYTTDI